VKRNREDPEDPEIIG